MIGFLVGADGTKGGAADMIVFSDEKCRYQVEVVDLTLLVVRGIESIGVKEE